MGKEPLHWPARQLEEVRSRFRSYEARPCHEHAETWQRGCQQGTTRLAFWHKRPSLGKHTGGGYRVL